MIIKWVSSFKNECDTFLNSITPLVIFLVELLSNANDGVNFVTSLILLTHGIDLDIWAIDTMILISLVQL